MPRLMFVSSGDKWAAVTNQIADWVEFTARQCSADERLVVNARTAAAHRHAAELMKHKAREH